MLSSSPLEYLQPGSFTFRGSGSNKQSQYNYTISGGDGKGTSVPLGGARLSGQGNVVFLYLMFLFFSTYQSLVSRVDESDLLLQRLLFLYVAEILDEVVIVKLLMFIANVNRK